MTTIKIELTEKQAKELVDILFQCQDEGPPGEGWASPELEELRTIVEAAIAAGPGD